MESESGMINDSSHRALQKGATGASQTIWKYVNEKMNDEKQFGGVTAFINQDEKGFDGPSLAFN